MRIEIRVISNHLEMQQALKIREVVFVQEQKVPMELEIDEYENESIHFLAFVDDSPAATGRIRKKNFEIKFERIATLNAMRGKGVGRELMLYMQEYAKKIFPNLPMSMHAQESAIGFYQKLGWVSQGELFEEAGILHQSMVKIS